ncbi:MAG: hypothetical protein ACJ75H_12550 [Thermoanaerobaculia bacterium]
MFCPDCGGDHEGEDSHCPDWEGDGDPGEFIPLIQVTDASEFQALAHLLEEEGIPWFIQSEPSLGLPAEPEGSVAMVYVAENHFPQARRALEAVLPVGVERQL